MKTQKEIANTLASLLMVEQNNKNEIDHLFAQLQPEVTTVEPIPPVEESWTAMFRASKMVGIWEPQSRNGKQIYQRKLATQPDWSLWASIHEIPPKSYKKRIVLLGESVARGYFYDPMYSVAQELESVLNISGEFNGIEVIDLAKTSMFIDELTLLVESCIALEPDAMVLFAGNNWLAKLAGDLDENDFKKMKEIYLQDQFPGVKTYLEQKFTWIISEFFKTVNESSRQARIPVTVVLPGFNLGDWKSDEIERIFAWQPGQSLEEWVAARKNAEQALIDKDYSRLETAARQMIEIDPSNPRGYELLSNSLMEKGQIQEAIDCLDLAKDTTILSRGNNSKPRCFKIVRDTLKKEALRAGMEVVDLFSIFNQAFPKEIPGKEFYLDYCHLSLQGIKIGMKYTAKALIEGLKHKTLHIDEMPDTVESIDDSIQAMAHFCAAIHNAHYGQEEEILDYHCQQAVRLNPNIKGTILQYIDFSTRKTSTILCDSFGEVIMNGAIRQYEGGLALLHPNGKKMMDIALINALIRALQSIGENCEEEIRQLRIREHGVSRTPLELLESYYQMTSYNDFVQGQKTSFLQIRNTCKNVHFVNSGKEDLTFQLVYRNSMEASIDHLVKIFINDKTQPVIQLNASKDWCNESFDISASMLKNGVNQLMIEWPTKVPSPSNGEKTVDQFLNNLFPIIGEIYSLTVRIKE